jgi:hypothetical protein
VKKWFIIIICYLIGLALMISSVYNPLLIFIGMIFFGIGFYGTYYYIYKWQKREAAEVIAEGVRRGTATPLSPYPPPPLPPPPPEAVCPTCGGPMAYIEKHQRWYCYKCKKYA